MLLVLCAHVPDERSPQIAEPLPEYLKMRRS
jgi:hypothetical protein